MSRSYRKIIRNRKQRIERRLAPINWEEQAQPMLKASNIHYEMAEKTEAISYGGIGAMHKMIGKLGLVDEIDRELHLLKKHLPYHESDHVLNLTYNALLAASGSKTSSCGATTKSFSMPWAHSGYRIRRRVGILPGAAMSDTS